MKVWLRGLMAVMLVVGLSGCGGGDTKNTPQPHEQAGERTAYIIDGPVSGLGYVTQSQSGTTGTDGSFRYRTNDASITFKVGNITLGTIAVADIPSDYKVFLQDLVGVSRETVENSKLLKIATLLQSLDSDGDHSVINLSKADLDKLTERKNIDDVDVGKLLSRLGKTPEKIDTVKEHLGDTIRAYNIAKYNYAPQAQDTNITTYKNTLTEEVFRSRDKNDNHLQYIIVSNPEHGKVEPLEDSSAFKYTPDQDYIGDDSFTYRAYDGEKYSRVATVQITVKDIAPTLSDTIPPSRPTIVSINAEDDKITLFWLTSKDAVTDDKEIRYEVHIAEDANFTADDTTLKQTVVNTQEADIVSLDPDTLYYVKVRALDRSDNAAESQEMSIRTSPDKVHLSSTTSIKKAADLHLENAVKKGDTLVFEDSKKAKLPKAGDILVGTREDAYLKKVVAVERQGDTARIVTEPATISEMVDTAKITSKMILFDTASTQQDNSAIRRKVIYRTNNTKVTTSSWHSGRLSVSETKKLPISSPSIRRKIIKSNDGFTAKVIQDNITIRQNDTLQIDIEGAMKQAGIDDDWKFYSIKMVSLTHPDKSNSGNFGAWFTTTEYKNHSVKGYMKWTPRKRYVSTEPYTATFKICAKDTVDEGVFDIMNDKCETLTSRITVIGDGKVDTGGETTRTLSTGSEFSNDVTLDFTPELVIEHELDGTSVKHVKVELSGKLVFDVLSKFKYSASASTEKTVSIIAPKTYTSVYLAAGIPIYQEITYSVDAEYSASAEGSIEATSNLQTTFEISAGMEYDGSGWHKIEKRDFRKDYTATIEAAGGVSVHVRLIPNVEVKFYKVASAGLSVEPWLKGDIKASATAILNTDGTSLDTLATHNLEELNVDVGLEGKVYADLTIWKWNLAHYPSGGGKKTIFNPTLNVFSIPEIELADNGADICSETPYKISATIKNPESSLLSNPFVEDSIRWMVFPHSGATITPAPENKKEATFRFNKQDEYTVYMMGYSEKLGSFVGNQYVTFTIDTRDCEIRQSDIMPPSFTSPASVSVNENQLNALTLQATDESNITYSISGGDSDAFSVDPVSGVVVFKNVPDYESGVTHYTFTARVTDDAGNEATQSIDITILDVDESSADTTPPQIVIKGDNPATVEVGTNYTDAGATAHDDVDENVSVVILSNTVNTSVSGDYIVIYHASDSAGNEANATRVVHVVTATNQPPTANAGADQQVESNATVTLDGSGSSDPDGQIVSYVWTENGTQVGTGVSVALDNVPDGVHTYILTVTDDDNATASDSVAVRVGSTVTTQLKKTGQTKSYDEHGTEVARCAVEDDGCYQKGITPSYTRDDTKEIVTDNITGLQWQDNNDTANITKPWLTQENYDKCTGSNGQTQDTTKCTDTSGDTAATYCSNLVLGGHSDWRLPTIDELMYIADRSRRSPAIDPTFQNTRSDVYWSSTSFVGNEDYAWNVYFDDGNDYWYHKSNSRYVRCVRAGE